MARYKDTVWNLNENVDSGGTLVGMSRRQVAALMDIRDELKSLNAVFHCANFMQLPHLVKQLRDNTSRRPPHRRLPRTVSALEIAAKQADEALDIATRERERVVSALTEAYRRAK